MSLDHSIRLAQKRAERFETLRAAYFSGDLSQTGFESNDLCSLARGTFPKLYEGLEIPDDLVKEAMALEKEHDELGYSMFGGPSEKERREKKDRLVAFFKRCRTVEERLYALLEKYRQEHETNSRP